MTLIKAMARAICEEAIYCVDPSECSRKCPYQDHALAALKALAAANLPSNAKIAGVEAYHGAPIELETKAVVAVEMEDMQAAFRAMVSALAGEPEQGCLTPQENDNG